MFMLYITQEIIHTKWMKELMNKNEWIAYIFFTE